ncbi:MAG: LTA synthase family protein [Bacteroidales bacterium]|nr:LTA synthase family protein [Bacteroidales bacterium]
MVRIFASLLRQFIFWLLFFALNRTIFLVYYNNLISLESPGFGEVMAGFWHALRLDVSTASYLLILPFFLLLFQSLINSRIFDLANKVYTAIVILAYTLITTAELGIYAEWKTKLHYKALHYLSNPDEIYNSASTWQFIWLVVIFVIVVIISIIAYTRFIYPKPLAIKRNYAGSLLFFIITPILLFLGIRGGMQEIPITQSQSFYSKYNILNLAAVNSGYSFTFSIMENYRFMKENPYQFYDDKEAQKVVADINYLEKDTTINILNTQRPNIVILLLESWSADLIYSLGGKEGITPEFEKLARDGILFTQLYASGNRSEQAMSAIFGGFPATPITAITHNLDKVVKLPSLPESLKEEGYHTSFYFGGHLMYGGIKSYVSISGFDEMIEIYDLPDSLPRGKLGVHDEYLFNYQIAELNRLTQPFFSVVFSMSTHSPYDQPMEKVLDWGGSENEYINSAYYTDKCLLDYFTKASQQNWYDSTLFIIIADHSHNSYRHWPVHSPQYRHIPMLLYGNVIREDYRGTEVGRLSSQTDIPVTLLKQLGLNTKEFSWSRDLFNPYSPEFVFYEATNGVGWMRDSGYFVWNKSYGFLEMELQEQHKDSLIMEGKAYLQVLFREFMDY